MELVLLVPLMLGVLKIVGGIIAVVMAVPFVIGLLIGWFVARAV